MKCSRFFSEIPLTGMSVPYNYQKVGYAQGCSGAETRENGVPTPFSCFGLRLVRSCFKMASFFGCVPTPCLLELHPWLRITIVVYDRDSN